MRMHVIATSSALIALSFSVSATAAVGFIEFIEDGVNGADGLAATQQVVISPDDKHLYSCSMLDDAITVLQRGASTGGLLQAQIVQDDQAGADGLDGCSDLTITHDGAYVYSVSQAEVVDGQGEGIAIFSRDSSSGQLSFINFYNDDDEAPNNTFRLPNGLVSSIDSQFLYVTDNNDAVLTFAIANNGQLSLSQRLILTESAARNLLVSADGKNVYGLEPTSNGGYLTVFSRNAVNGVLTLMQTIEAREPANVAGVNGITDARISADGKYLYTASFVEGVSIFQRNTNDGMLTFIETINTLGDTGSALRASDLAISANQELLYVVDGIGEQIAVFDRSSEDGSISYLGRIQQSNSAADGLDGANSAQISTDSAHLYVSAGNNDDGVSVYDLRSDLSVIKTDSADPVAPSATFSYNLNVTNNGPALASNVSISDLVPSQLSIISVEPAERCAINGQNVSCSIPSLSATTNTVVTVTVAAPATEGSISNTVMVESDQIDAAIENNTDTESTEVSNTGSGSDPTGEEGGGGGLALYWLVLLAIWSRRKYMCCHR